MVPTYYHRITEQTKQTEDKAKAGVLVLIAKILAGISAFLLLKATDAGDVTVVQALDGLKFVFILVITVFFARFLPDTVATTETRKDAIVRQVLYVAIITVGYFILFL